MSDDSHFKLDASGPPGHSLFSNFKTWCLREISVDEIQVELDESVGDTRRPIKRVDMIDKVRVLISVRNIMLKSWRS